MSDRLGLLGFNANELLNMRLIEVKNLYPLWFFSIWWLVSSFLDILKLVSIALMS